jgi:integrase
LSDNKSPYAHLLDDAAFKRWVENVKRGSQTYGYEVVRRMGYVERRFGKSPKVIAEMDSKKAANFLLDLIGELESEKKSGSYISNIVKAVRGWLEFNGIQIQQKIKIRNRDELTRVADERPPTQEELRKILNATDMRFRAATAIVAFSGVRLEVLGDYLGQDGLKVQDIPEMTIENGVVSFKKIPTKIMIRRNLSKTKTRYFTFLCQEGCDYLKEYLELRMRNGETLGSESPIVTPSKAALAGDHIRTTNIGDLIRKYIVEAGFAWRPYVLRRYFDTRLMMAEGDGLLIRDYRIFWMGHRGDMEHTYTVNKGLTDDTIEKMRESYAKAAARYLQTKRFEAGEDKIREAFRKQLLAVAGFSEEEIENQQIDKLTDEEFHKLVKQRLLGAVSSNGSKQKVVTVDDMGQYLDKGWEYVASIGNERAIIKMVS